MKYGTLSATNPEYLGDVWSELDDLYEGGYRIAQNAGKYLPKLVGELPRRYAERIHAASYLNYVGQIVDYFAAALFANGCTVLPAVDAEDTGTPGEVPEPQYYQQFAKNADRKGKEFAGVCKEAFTSAILKRRGAIQVDFPPASPSILTRADEDRLGAARAYCFSLPVESILDWHANDDGELDWAIVYERRSDRQTPEDSRDKHVDSFRIWRRSPEGVVTWELYQTSPFDASKEEPKPEDDVPLVSSGVASFKRIPIVFIEVSKGLWIGNKVGPGNREHFQRRSSLVSAENRSMLAIPYVKLGPEVSAPGQPLPSMVQQDPNRGENPAEAFIRAGFMALGSGDEIGFAEPSGGSYALVDQQLSTLKDELFRVAHQMAASVSNTNASLGRSGLSKAEDRVVEGIVLAAYAEIMKPVAKRVYELIAEARGENVVWAVHGLDGFDSDNRDMLLKEALAVQSIPIPSTTWRKTYYMQLATKLVAGAPPETIEQIRKEISESADSELDLDTDKMRKQLEAEGERLDAAKNKAKTDDSGFAGERLEDDEE